MYLADACALVVFLTNSRADAAMPRAAEFMRTAEIGVLPTTVWEIARKAAIGKLPVFWTAWSSLSDMLQDQGFLQVATDWRDAEAASTLPALHRDPMDRLLIATALRAGLTVLTQDQIFPAYGVATIW